jgi:hypothetical protein
MLNDFQKRDILLAVNKDVDTQIMTCKDKPFTAKKISKMRMQAFDDYRKIMEEMNTPTIQEVEKVLEGDQTPDQESHHEELKVEKANQEASVVAEEQQGF